MLRCSVKVLALIRTSFRASTKRYSADRMAHLLKTVHAFRRAELAASAARHAFPIGDVSPPLAPSAPLSGEHSAHWCGAPAGVVLGAMPAAVGVRAGRSSIGLTAPNELGGELRDGHTAGFLAA